MATNGSSVSVAPRNPGDPSVVDPMAGTPGGGVTLAQVLVNGNVANGTDIAGGAGQDLVLVGGPDGGAGGLITLGQGGAVGLRTAGSTGAAGDVLLSDGTDTGWGGGLMFSRRLTSPPLSSGDSTFAIDSAAYIASGTMAFFHDWTRFPATHFLITIYGRANEAAQTVSAQLAQFASPTNPVSAAGDDISVPNNGGANQGVSSGWVPVSDALAGILLMVIALKGSNATVDLTGRWVDVAFKVE